MGDEKDKKKKIYFLILYWFSDQDPSLFLRLLIFGTRKLLENNSPYLYSNFDENPLCKAVPTPSPFSLFRGLASNQDKSIPESFYLL